MMKIIIIYVCTPWTKKVSSSSNIESAQHSSPVLVVAVGLLLKILRVGETLPQMLISSFVSESFVGNIMSFHYFGGLTGCYMIISSSSCSIATRTSVH